MCVGGGAKVDDDQDVASFAFDSQPNLGHFQPFFFSLFFSNLEFGFRATWRQSSSVDITSSLRKKIDTDPCEALAGLSHSHFSKVHLLFFQLASTTTRRQRQSLETKDFWHRQPCPKSQALQLHRLLQQHANRAAPTLPPTTSRSSSSPRTSTIASRPTTPNSKRMSPKLPQSSKSYAKSSTISSMRWLPNAPNALKSNSRIAIMRSSSNAKLRRP